MTRLARFSIAQARKRATPREPQRCPVHVAAPHAECARDANHGGMHLMWHDVANACARGSYARPRVVDYTDFSPVPVDTSEWTDEQWATLDAVRGRPIRSVPSSSVLAVDPSWSTPHQTIPVLVPYQYR